MKLRASLSAWTQKQSKHAAVAYPLITCLVCLEDDDTFANDVDPLVDNLHRIFKASLVACRLGNMIVPETGVPYGDCSASPSREILQGGPTGQLISIDLMHAFHASCGLSQQGIPSRQGC